MSLHLLAARVCRTFVAFTGTEMRVVQKVKDGQSRDVVTGLDERLNDVTARFVAENLPGCVFLSEEGEQVSLDESSLQHDEFLVVDPLDGTNNFALAMPGYGFMAAHLRAGEVIGSVVVLPEHDLYFVLEAGAFRTSLPFTPPASAPSGTTYYAYPPKLSEAAAAARPAVLSCIDSRTSGVYRSGSACMGLFNLLSGRHAAFVGVEVRIWDALAYLPLLAHYGFAVRYRIAAGRLTLVASKDSDLVAALSAAVTSGGAAQTLHAYTGTERLVIE
jgi:myo-inositol-1(or 4)-monophosphatase